jgi:PAS domain-containing protein
MKFSYKMALALSVIVVLPLGTAGIVFVRMQREMLMTHTRESHLAIAQALASEFRYTIQHIRRDLTAAGSVFNTPPLREDDVLSLLDVYLRENDVIHAVGMYNAEGALIETLTKNPSVPSELPSLLPASVLTALQSSESSRNQSVNSLPSSTVWWAATSQMTQQEAKKHPDSNVIKGTVPFIPIAVTVRGNRFSGRLIAMLSRQDCAGFLRAAALQAFGVERGMIHCVDSDFRLVASTESTMQDMNAETESVLRKQFLAQDVSKTDGSINGSAKNTNAVIASPNTTFFQSIGTPQEYTNARGEDVLATKASVPFTNLSIIIEQPRAIVYKSLLDIQTGLFFIFLVVCSGTLGFGFYLSAQFMLPLRQLVQAGSEMDKQNYHIRLQRKQNDEFADVFRAFNEAANQLEHVQRLDVNKLLLERNKFEIIMRQAMYGVLILTPEKTIMLANDTFAGYLRQDPVALEGVKVDEALRGYDELLGYISNAFDEVTATQEIAYIENLRFTPLGETIPRIFQSTLNKIVLDRQLVALVVSLVDYPSNDTNRTNA